MVWSLEEHWEVNISKACYPTTAAPLFLSVCDLFHQPLACMRSEGYSSRSVVACVCLSMLILAL